jgi:hypothetical protein
MKYGVGSRGYMRTAEIAGINLAVGYSIMHRYLVALGAEYAVWVTQFQQGIKTGVFVREVLVKLFNGKLCGFHVLFSTFNLYLNYSMNSPCCQGIEYKDFIKKSVLLRDNYLYERETMSFHNAMDCPSFLKREKGRFFYA